MTRGQKTSIKTALSSQGRKITREPRGTAEIREEDDG